jgi:cytochrome P450
MSFIPPRPGLHTQGAKFGSRFGSLVGGLFSRGGRSMLNLLPERVYSVQMGHSRLARQALFIVNSPQTLREVLVDRASDFPKHHYLADILKPLIGYSLFNANGPAWAQQRRLVDQAFVQAGLRRAFPLMTTAIADMTQRIDTTADGRPWNAEAAMSHVTADIIFRTILSTPLDAVQAAAVQEAFSRYQVNAQRVMGLSALYLPTFWHRHLCRQQGAAIRAPFSRLIRQRFAAVRQQQTGLPDDMLAALMAACDPQTGATLSEEDVIDQVGTLFLAGHETSATTLGWALYLLACQPALQSEVRQEIIDAWGTREPDYGDTRQLAGLQNVFKETLRLYPPIAFYLREAAGTECLRGKPVTAGDTVTVSPWIVQRHRTLWEAPDAFDPKRFCSEAGQASAKTAYLPFGLGPRACPGAAFATQESLLILAQLLRRYRIDTVPGHVPRPSARLTLRSANGMQLRLTRLVDKDVPQPVETL